MVDDNEHDTPASEPLFADPAPPTVFADSVLNLARSREVAKFYLVRNDPSLSGDNVTSTQVVCQVVMPIRGFVETALFFEHTLKDLIRTEVVSESSIEEIKKAVFGDK